MDTKRITYLLLVSFFFYLLPLNAQEAWSLEKCIAQCHEKNLLIKASELNQGFTESNLRQSKLALAPNLNANVSQGFSFGRSADPFTGVFTAQNLGSNSFSLSSGVTLYNGSIRTNTIRQFKYEMELRDMETEEVKDALTFQVLSAYLRILLSEEEVTISENQIQQSKDRLENASKLAESGVIPEGDLLELEAQLASDELVLIDSKNNLDLAYMDMVQLLELSPAEASDFRVAKPDIENFNTLLMEEVPDVEEVFKIASETMPMVQKNEWAMKQAEIGQKIARGSYFPSLSVFGDLNTVAVNTTNSGFDFGSYGSQLSNNRRESLGISMSIPIFNNGQVKRGVEFADLNVMVLDNQQKQTLNQLRKDVMQVITNLNSNALQYTASLKSFEAANNAFNFAESKFNLGQANSLEYSTARNNLARATTMFITAKYNYIFALKSLDYYLNRPIKL